MFAYLRGVLAAKKPGLAVVDIGGVGYEVRMTAAACDRLPAEGALVHLHVCPCYREDSVTLYGFPTGEEKKLFTLLLGVGGVGPKLALAIMSGAAPAVIVNAIAGGDEKSLGAISGVGKKLSQRLVMELRDRVGEVGETLVAGREPALERDAVGALVTLGYPRLKAVAAVQAVLRLPGDVPASLEALVKEALKMV